MSQDIVPDLRFLEKILEAELHDAIKAHEIAQGEFRLVCSSRNGGLRNKTKHTRSLQQDITRYALVKALMRFNDLIRRGAIPDDLKNLTVRGERTAERDAI